MEINTWRKTIRFSDQNQCLPVNEQYIDGNLREEEDTRIEQRNKCYQSANRMKIQSIWFHLFTAPRKFLRDLEQLQTCRSLCIAAARRYRCRYNTIILHTGIDQERDVEWERNSGTLYNDNAGPAPFGACWISRAPFSSSWF